jgi:hypothetical protein
MSSRESIASQALSLLGANTISSFDEGTNEANIINDHYDQFIRNMFSLYPWSFATKKVTLEQYATDPLNEYKFQYVRPDQALYIFKIFDSISYYADTIVDFDILEDLILCNYDNPVVAQYSVYKEENLWPGYFAEFAVNALAATIAIPVTHNAELASLYDTKAFGDQRSVRKGGLFARAVGADSRQKPPIALRGNPIISSRYRNGGFFGLCQY